MSEDLHVWRECTPPEEKTSNYFVCARCRCFLTRRRGVSNPEPNEPIYAQIDGKYTALTCNDYVLYRVHES